MPATHLFRNCFTVKDNETVSQNAEFLVSKRGSKHDHLARLANQFIDQNLDSLKQYDVNAFVDYDGYKVSVKFQSGDFIGACPLKSPITGKDDYGLVVRPRFDWSGLGKMLGIMGWKIIPEVQKNLPNLPQSEREIPAWVLSSIILARIKSMLMIIDRRFDFESKELSTPRGRINWEQYLTQNMPALRCLSVPCTYPELSKNRDLLSAIHFVLRQQIGDLETQKESGFVVIKLIEECENLISQVNAYPAKEPSPLQISSWLRGKFQSDVLHNGLEAMNWSIENRGLAGLFDLRGLPWKMYMPSFYEAWVETVLKTSLGLLGGILSTGRKYQTVKPIAWDFPPTGSQKSLKPDFILEKGNEVIIVDAKYKPHWHELNTTRWAALSSQIHESHRADILQILAYSTLFNKKVVKVCLAYPCWQKTWNSLKQKEMLSQKASIYAENRKITVILTAIPMSDNIQDVRDEFVKALM